MGITTNSNKTMESNGSNHSLKLLTKSTTNTGARGKRRWIKGQSKPNNKFPKINTYMNKFQGANTDLKGKVFIKVTIQATKYDEAYKVIILYIGNKYNNKVYKVFKTKDTFKGMNLIKKPVTLKITNIFKVPSIGENGVLRVLDRDSKDFVEYQITLKNI